MSIDMEVFIEKPIPIELFLAAAQKELAEISSVLTGEIEICEYQNHVKLPLVATHIGDTRPMLLITIHGKHPVLVVTIGMEELGPNDTQILIDFSVSGGGGNPCMLVLAAACAISLARLAGSDVNGKTPDEFADYVRDKNYQCIPERAVVVPDTGPTISEDGTYEIISEDGVRYIVHTSGQLLRLIDQNGNITQY